MDRRRRTSVFGVVAVVATAGLMLALGPAQGASRGCAGFDVVQGAWPQASTAERSSLAKDLTRCAALTGLGTVEVERIMGAPARAQGSRWDFDIVAGQPAEGGVFVVFDAAGRVSHAGQRTGGFGSTR